MTAPPARQNAARPPEHFTVRLELIRNFGLRKDRMRSFLDDKELTVA